MANTEQVQVAVPAILTALPYTALVIVSPAIVGNIIRVFPVISQAMLVWARAATIIRAVVLKAPLLNTITSVHRMTTLPAVKANLSAASMHLVNAVRSTNGVTAIVVV